ncbi:minor capsid protein [Glutamicibacter sp. MCAF14]|uniref:minor capsid protein n=1 Tax=Glutamicibacter sp. MCAF14 TaxID=3233043 RepID=UPI003F90CF12
MFQTDFMTAIATLLHDLGIGTFRTSGTYTSTETAISFDQLPPDPDRAIAIALYPVADEGTTDSIQGIQFRIRGPRNDRRFVKDTTDRIFDAFHDLKHTTWGTTPVVRVYRNSGANLPADANNRQEATQNYYAQITRSGTHRKD